LRVYWVKFVFGLASRWLHLALFPLLDIYVCIYIIYVSLVFIPAISELILFLAVVVL
jgi:hypothetical protein